MSKYHSGYSIREIVELLRIIKNLLYSKTDTAGSAYNVTKVPEEELKIIIRRISAGLDKIGVNSKTVGHAYLIDAI